MTLFQGHMLLEFGRVEKHIKLRYIKKKKGQGLTQLLGCFHKSTILECLTTCSDGLLCPGIVLQFPFPPNSVHASVS